MSFTQLGLSAPLLKALDDTGYTTPTPIQNESIPHILSQKDIFGCAQTGTGKTAAFALPLLQLLTACKSGQTGKTGIQALVLAPTRELATQIHESFGDYGKYLRVRHAVIFGGVSQKNQVAALQKGVDLLVATPGRLIDLMGQGFIRLDQVKFLVLDEADRMLDMGFINDIRRILSKIPAQRQTLFFSATAAPDIMKLANTILKNPVHVAVTPVSSTVAVIRQAVYHVEKANKRHLLDHLLKQGDIDHALVFTRTRRGADRLAKDLNKKGHGAEAIHGDKSQNARDRALNGFRSRKIRVLVATDVASRGIDIDKLTHVINYELPEQAETYVHRIGRTGRAGEGGNALSFCSREELSYLKDIQKTIKKNIPVMEAHPFR